MAQSVTEEQFNYIPPLVSVIVAAESHEKAAAARLCGHWVDG